MTTELNEQLIYYVYITTKPLYIIIGKLQWREEKINIKTTNNTKVYTYDLEYMETENLIMILTSHCFIFFLIKDDNELLYLSKRITDIFVAKPKIETVFNETLGTLFFERFTEEKRCQHFI